VHPQVRVGEVEKRGDYTALSAGWRAILRVHFPEALWLGSDKQKISQKWSLWGVCKRGDFIPSLLGALKMANLRGFLFPFFSLLVFFLLLIRKRYVLLFAKYKKVEGPGAKNFFEKKFLDNIEALRNYC